MIWLLPLKGRMPRGKQDSKNTQLNKVEMISKTKEHLQIVWAARGFKPVNKTIVSISKLKLKLSVYIQVSPFHTEISLLAFCKSLVLRKILKEQRKHSEVKERKWNPFKENVIISSGRKDSSELKFFLETRGDHFTCKYVLQMTCSLINCFLFIVHVNYAKKRNCDLYSPFCRNENN